MVLEEVVLEEVVLEEVVLRGVVLEPCFRQWTRAGRWVGGTERFEFVDWRVLERRM